MLNIIFENCIINKNSIKVVKMYAVNFDGKLDKQKDHFKMPLLLLPLKEASFLYCRCAR